ncbi:hypothetical protein DBR43_31785 [Pedobacter sp. KBW06]|uniref:reverse transcriptase domain-containing protein n=1 Tax=Pedobacter sp. KBW06 TaxID=2153359 RepID=UPI000F5B60CC|nr:reverse transcriptase domain-containing protein [Pedobacter sp. KBW06]RQO64863.1 hypothetical protein DBR43_31785 [Pedobacter sp. KBW06]
MATPRKKRLLTQISSPSHLKKAWTKLNKTNKESRGISEETISDFTNNLESNLIEISKRLKAKTYKFSDVRPVLIPKNEKKQFRPLRLSEISDRVVQKALALKLEELLSEKYKLDNPCSFAYRKEGKVEDAVKKMVEYYKEGFHYILEADIKKFFDNVNRKKLLKKVFDDLPDNTINKLIREALEQNIGDLSHYETQHHHYFLDSMQGIPQGNSLSPLLANIYLADFDQRMITEKLRLVRYADDFIVMCKDEAQAKQALQIAKEEIEAKLGLSIHDLPSPAHLEGSKTRIVNPIHHRFSFLSISFDGKKAWVKPSKINDLRTKINDITNISSYKNDPKFQGLPTILKRLKNLLEGWLSAFKYVDVDREFQEIDDHINYKILTVLVKMDFRLKTNNVETKKIKSIGKTIQLISKTQRENIGVPTCANFLSSIERGKIHL